MSNLANAVNANTHTTENGMSDYKSSMNNCLDLFFKIGSSRNIDLTDLFLTAYAEDKELATRIVLWARDCRGGAGERSTPRKLIRNICMIDEDIAKRVISRIPELGRWDDVVTFIGISKDIDAHVKELMWNAMGKLDGLFGKWMPRKGYEAVKVRNLLGLSPKEYRKTMVALSKTVEQQMCAKQWSEIKYASVPSVAMSRYKNAFNRNDNARYGKYIEEVLAGKTEIKAGAVFPHDVIRNMSDADATQAQWNNLPDFVEGGSSSTIPIVDISDSMTWFKVGGCLDPRTVATALGIYVAERNVGPFQNEMITFAGEPTYFSLKGSIKDKVNIVKRQNVGGNTDLQKVFKMILKSAQANNLSQEDLPKNILILSDMQFDRCTGSGSYYNHNPYNDKAHEMIERMYHDAGYEMPQVVFWNMDARSGHGSPVTFNQHGFALISGYSPSILKNVLSGKGLNPLEMMKETVNVERYNF